MYCKKTLKPVLRSFLTTLVFGTALFTACSSEEEITNNNEMLVVQRPSNIVDAELTQKVISFYGNVTFTKGRTVSTNVNGVYYDCTELIINSDTRARGYIFSEQQTGDYLYIADVDIENYILRTYDFVTSQEDVVSDINQVLDLYEIIVKNPIIENPKTTDGRFWGWSCGVKVYLPGNGFIDGTCVQVCNYYALGIKLTNNVIKSC